MGDPPPPDLAAVQVCLSHKSIRIKLIIELCCWNGFVLMIAEGHFTSQDFFHSHFAVLAFHVQSATSSLQKCSAFCREVANVGSAVAKFASSASLFNASQSTWQSLRLKVP
jgi:hypothetical protein